MRVLVTGVAGFVGSSIASALLRQGDVDVVGVDCLTDYYDRRLKLANLDCLAAPRLTYHDADLNSADLDALLDGVDVIYHQAGQPGVRGSWGTQFDGYLRNNVHATQRLLEAAAGVSRLQRFVYASSSSIYGEAARYPTGEADVPQPRSPYGVTKLAAEHLCSLYAQTHGVPTVSLRYFTVYGPRQRPDMAFTKFIRAGMAGLSLPLYGDGKQVRDFTFIDDVVRANLMASTAPVEPGAVLNIAGGSSVTVNDVLEMLQDTLGQPLCIEHGPVVVGDVAQTGADTDRAHEVLGWHPEVSLEDGLARQVEWCRQATAR